MSDVLIVIMCAVLCGLDQLCDIVVFSQNKKDFFKKNLKIENIPSKATFSRILNMIDGEEVGKVIINIMQERVEFVGNIIAVDGKTIRSTSKEGESNSALQILTAYLTESGITLGQKAIDRKINEIPVFQEMLNFIDIKGKTITADAMHCQKDTCKKIIQKQGNYVFGLKENQKKFYNDVKWFMNFNINSKNSEEFITVEKSRGRIEKRICTKVTDSNWLKYWRQWHGISAIFAIRRIVTFKNKTTDETNYYITSLNETAEKLMEIVREHWKIESLHWLLDVVFSEDKCKIISENGHKTLNIFRKLALLIHRQFIDKHKKKSSIKSNLLKCLISEDSLLHLLKNL